MPVSLRLFLIFLRIGATSFGGNVALVAAVRKELCQKHKMLTDAQLLDFMTLCNLLPGPLATNVCAACGFEICGMTGVIASLTGVLLPTFILVCIFSEFYLRYGEQPVITSIFSGLLPGVAAIIAYTAWSLAKKNIRTVFQGVLLVLAGTAILLLRGFFATLSIIVISGLLGFFFSKRMGGEYHEETKTRKKISLTPVIVSSLLLITGIIVFFIHPAMSPLRELRQIGLTFSSMSVTLFGGGYVFIPAIEKVVVGVYHWVTSQEFAAAIAISQVTPGPISISAAFVGWKVAGLGGALIATLGIFIPPSLLSVLAQQFISKIKGRPSVAAVFSGVRPAVIGMIAASVWLIAKSAPIDWQSAVIFLVIFTLALWKDLDTAILIPLAGVLGWALHLL